MDYEISFCDRMYWILTGAVPYDNPGRSAEGSAPQRANTGKRFRTSPAGVSLWKKPDAQGHRTEIAYQSVVPEVTLQILLQIVVVAETDV